MGWGNLGLVTLIPIDSGVTVTMELDRVAKRLKEDLGSRDQELEDSTNQHSNRIRQRKKDDSKSTINQCNT